MIAPETTFSADGIRIGWRGVLSLQTCLGMTRFLSHLMDSLERFELWDEAVAHGDIAHLFRNFNGYLEPFKQAGEKHERQG